MGFSLRRMMEYLYDPGHVIAYTAYMGGGKSHLAVAFNEWNVKHRSNCHLLTNIVFLRFKGWRQVEKRDGAMVTRPTWEEEYPPGVHKVTSMEDVFRRTAEILLEDEDSVILLPIDEFQNFVVSDLNDYMAITFVKYVANCRKFRHVPQPITPAKNNILRRVREFFDNPTYGGYLYAHFYKSKFEVQEYNSFHGTDLTTQQTALLKISHDQIWPNLVTVPVTEWAKPWDMLEAGDIIYDHRAPADFSLGNFDFAKLMRRVGGVPYYRIPSAIQDYFDELDRRRSINDVFEDPTVLRAMRVYQMRYGMDEQLRWDDIARIERTPRQTLQSELKRHIELVKGLGECEA